MPFGCPDCPGRHVWREMASLPQLVHRGVEREKIYRERERGERGRERERERERGLWGSSNMFATKNSVMLCRFAS